MEQNSSQKIDELIKKTHDYALHTEEKTQNYKDKHFKGQQNNEQLICFFRQHWLSVMPRLFTMIIFLLIAVFFLFSVPPSHEIGTELIPTLYGIGFLVFSIFGTIYLHLFFLSLISHYTNVTMLSSNRLVMVNKTVYLRNTHESIDLRLIEDVSKTQQGLIKNILNYGEVIITLSDLSKVIRFVPNPDFHFRTINKAVHLAKSGLPVNLKYISPQKKN